VVFVTEQISGKNIMLSESIVLSSTKSQLLGALMGINTDCFC